MILLLLLGKRGIFGRNRGRGSRGGDFLIGKNVLIWSGAFWKKVLREGGENWGSKSKSQSNEFIYRYSIASRREGLLLSRVI